MRWGSPVRAAVLLCLVAALAGCDSGDPAEGGDELIAGSAYGATTTRDVGTQFTDGVTDVEITKGPIRLVSVTPVMDGTSLKYLGARVRLLGRKDWIPHTSADNFPPTHPEMAGSVPVEGFEVAGRLPGKEQTSIEIMFGFKVVGEGRTARRGAALVYEYQGERRKVFLPSHFAACSPKGVECADEDP